MNGFWIDIEGPDGSGKGIQSELLYQALVALGHNVVLTHEPWEGGPRGRLIRDILCHRVMELPEGSGKIDPTHLQWQYVYNRAFEHLPAVVIPALAKGSVLISDRGRVSTYAYGSAFGVPTEMVDEWHKLLVPRRPDMLIYLATDLKVCMARLKDADREGGPEYFERADKIARIIKHYDLVLHQYFGDVVVVIDNNKSVEDVHQQILDSVQTKLRGE